MNNQHDGSYYSITQSIKSSHAWNGVPIYKDLTWQIFYFSYFFILILLSYAHNYGVTTQQETMYIWAKTTKRNPKLNLH